MSTRPDLILWRMPTDGVILRSIFAEPVAGLDKDDVLVIPGRVRARTWLRPYVPFGATHFNVPPSREWLPLSKLPKEWGIPNASGAYVDYIDVGKQEEEDDWFDPTKEGG